MTNPTSNFGWQMPTPTDLVTDLPADFEVFGQAVDTSMADLKGGTTGQILSKATNADMDFTWITNDVGDITNIAVTSPITGGGSSGSVTIGVSAASTSAAGVVQLSDSTSTTSSVLASTPTATKSAYDLAAAAVPKSTVTTAGDVIYATGSAAVTRLGIGTANQVLAVNSGATAPEWKTISSGTFPVQRSANVAATFTTTSATWVDVTGYTLTFTPVSATNKITIGIDFNYTVGTTGANVEWRILRGATSIFYRASSINTSGLYTIQHFEVTDTNVAASSQTYKLQVQINGGFTYTNYNDTAGFTGSQIRSLEVY
jgi:hypothetical protein